MKVKHNKLAESGFSHIEAMLVALIVAVVVLAGSIVYSKNDTTHAGGYEVVGQHTFASPPLASYLKQAISVRACVAKSGTNWTVHSIWTSSYAYNNKIGVWETRINNFTTAQDNTVRGYSTGAQGPSANSVFNMELGVSSTVNNYLQFDAIFQGYQHYQSVDQILVNNIRPSNLPSC